MKKILVTFLCAAMLVAVAGMFACDISGDGTPHTHEYMQVAGERFLKSPATCTESAVYYYSCKCGEKAAETFTYGSPLGLRFPTMFRITTRPIRLTAQRPRNAIVAEQQIRYPMKEQCLKAVLNSAI